MIDILIVDDNEFDRAQIRRYVMRELPEASIREATTEDEFHTLLEEKEPDLIISDINIPDLDGLEVLDTAGSLKGEVPVVIHTGIGSEELAVTMLRRGCADYIIKSAIHSKEIGKRAASALAARRP